MSTITLALMWPLRWLGARLGLCFDLEGIALDDHELDQQLGFGRE